MYNLSFYEAIERCVNGEGYIRGDKFKDGIYVKKYGEALIAVDAFHSDKLIGNLYVSEGMMSQKYALFQEIDNDILKNDNNELHYKYGKAPWIDL